MTYVGSPDQENIRDASAVTVLVAALMAGICRPLCVYIRPFPCPRPTRPNVRWVSPMAFLPARGFVLSQS
jgi:hypothetical protein